MNRESRKNENAGFYNFGFGKYAGYGIVFSLGAICIALEVLIVAGEPVMWWTRVKDDKYIIHRARVKS